MDGEEMRGFRKDLRKILALVMLVGMLLILTGALWTLETRAEKRDLPDLTVTEITWTPLNPVNGELVTFNATVQNLGASTYSGFWVYFYLDNIWEIGWYWVSDGLMSGEIVYAIVNWYALGGIHNVTVYADYTDEITESNEENNTLTEQISISILTGHAYFVYVAEAVTLTYGGV